MTAYADSQCTVPTGMVAYNEIGTPYQGSVCIAYDGQPTRKPTEKPTVYPTAVGEVTQKISFQSNLTMQLGTAILQDSDKRAIIKTTASAVGLTPDHIRFLGYKATVQARRTLLGWTQVGSSSSLQSVSYSIQAQTEIEVFIAEFPPEERKNATAVFSSLKSMLVTAVQSDAFLTNLKAQSKLFWTQEVQAVQLRNY